jgi:hypothetical protein
MRDYWRRLRHRNAVHVLDLFSRESPDPHNVDEHLRLHFNITSKDRRLAGTIRDFARTQISRDGIDLEAVMNLWSGNDGSGFSRGQGGRGALYLAY